MTVEPASSLNVYVCVCLPSLCAAAAFVVNFEQSSGSLKWMTKEKKRMEWTIIKRSCVINWIKSQVKQQQSNLFLFKCNRFSNRIESHNMGLDWIEWTCICISQSEEEEREKTRRKCFVIWCIIVTCVSIKSEHCIKSPNPIATMNKTCTRYEKMKRELNRWSRKKNSVAIRFRWGAQYFRVTPHKKQSVSHLFIYQAFVLVVGIIS